MKKKNLIETLKMFSLFFLFVFERLILYDMWHSLITKALQEWMYNTRANTLPNTRMQQNDPFSLFIKVQSL